MDLDSDDCGARTRDDAPGRVDSRPPSGGGPRGDADEVPPVEQLLRTALDAATWGAVLLVGTSAILGLVGVVVGNGLVGFKRGLFVFGFLLVGVSLVALRPKRPGTRDRDDAASGPAGATSPESREDPDAAVGPPTLLPSSLAPDPAHRASWALRGFFGGVWALVVSYLLEAAFGVVPT